MARVKPGMREVALTAGVAVSSVSRVLSGHPDVSDAMRKRVLDAVGALGYEPDLIARSLRRGLTKTIGMLVADISSSVFAEVVVGAELTLQDAGHSLLIANSGGAAVKDARQLRVLLQRRVDGLVVSLSDEGDPHLRELLGDTEQPIVLLDREVAGLECSAVLFDWRAGVTDAASHLLTLGHRRIALVGGQPGIRPTRVWAQALEEACDRPGVRADVDCHSFTAEHGERATRKLLAQPEPPTAVIAGGNEVVIGVLRAIRGLGLRIPGDVSVVTFDRAALSDFLDPPLASIERDPRLMGRVAAELLLDALAGGPPAVRYLPTVFAPLQSCGPPGSGFPPAAP